MKWPWRKPKKLNETTRLYALYGESGNLEYLDNQDKDTIKRVEVVENNLQQTNQNLNQTNQSLNQTNQDLQNLTNRVDRLPTTGASKEYVDMQDGLLRTSITVAEGNINTNKRDITSLNENTRNIWTNLTDIRLALGDYANKTRENTFTEGNTFNKNLSVKGTTYLQGATFATGLIQCRNGIIIPPDSINHIHNAVNKQYADGVISKAARSSEQTQSTRINKKNLFPSYEMHWYDIVSGQSVSFNFVNLAPNKYYSYQVFIEEVKGYKISILAGTGMVQTSSNGSLFLNHTLPDITIPTWRDWWPGNNGVFSATVKYRCVINIGV